MAKLQKNSNNFQKKFIDYCNMQVNKLALSEFKNELVDLIIDIKNFIDISKYQDNFNQIDFNKIKITGYIEKLKTKDDINIIIVKIPLTLHNRSDKQLNFYKTFYNTFTTCCKQVYNLL